MLARFERSRPAFLASVMNAAEAEIALANGAEIIDGKNPRRGALGALDKNEIASIVAAAAGRAPVSATIGDHHGSIDERLEAIAATAAAGAGVVKIGFYGAKDEFDAVRELEGARLGSARMFAVLMADGQPDYSLLCELARAGFIGVMFDTFDKSRGSLSGLLSQSDLCNFLVEARRHDLVAGLAGSLGVADIAALAALQPDILGFRGALCASDRTGALEGSRVAVVRRALDGAREQNAGFERARASA